MKKLFLLNLFLRVALCFFVVFKGTWQAGDSLYYLEQAQKVLQGSWGGDGFRGVFYSWYLLLLAPHAFFNFNPQQILDSSPFALVLPLLVQSLLVWSCGYFLYKKKSPLLGLVVIFEPALFVYSHKIMSDVLFAVLCFWFGVFLWKWITELNKEKIGHFPFLCALFLACASITRSVGSLLICLALIYACLEFYLGSKIKRSIFRNQIFVFFFTLCIFLNPILYWNKKIANRWGTTTQGLEWLASVAGVVEYSAGGFSYQQAPRKWFELHPTYNLESIFHSLTSHFENFILLSLKGIFRVFFGHVNVEYYSLFTGTTIEGPGWFKPQEVFNGYYIHGTDIFFWVLGIAVNLLLCFVIYHFLFQKIRARWSLKENLLDSIEKRMIVFFIGCGLLQAILPLVYGDARFRLSLLMFWIIAAFLSEQPLEKAYQHKSNLHHQDQ